MCRATPTKTNLFANCPLLHLADIFEWGFSDKCDLSPYQLITPFRKFLPQGISYPFKVRMAPLNKSLNNESGLASNVEPPTRQGFGSKMIALSVSHELRGLSTTEWRSEGMAFDLSFQPADKEG